MSCVDFLSVARNVLIFSEKYRSFSPEIGVVSFYTDTLLDDNVSVKKNDDLPNQYIFCSDFFLNCKGTYESTNY